MADSKISALAALATSAIAAGDLIPIVDVSDTSMSGSGTNKVIDAGNVAVVDKANTFTADQSITGTLGVSGAVTSSSRITAQGFRTEQVTIASNDVYSFTPLATTGMLLLNSGSGGLSRQHTQALISYRNTSGVPAWCMILTQTSTYVETSTSVLTGTTGTIDRVTVSAVQATNKIYIENRTDASITINITVFA
jgi:hypothetical protein